MAIRIIIPACYHSKKLPGKVLMDIAGKSMLEHVYQRAKQSVCDSVVIATDDERIAEAAKGFGAEVLMTSSDHHSGTERLAEAVVALDYDLEDIVVNLPGNAPLIPVEALQSVIQALESSQQVSVTTLCYPIENIEEMFDPNIVKVVLNKRNYAMYFSRAPIAWERGKFGKTPPEIESSHYRHVDLYAYKAKFLEQYVSWDRCEVEVLEKLEQLRVIYHCQRILVVITDKAIPASVDTQEDLDHIRGLMA